MKARYDVPIRTGAAALDRVLASGLPALAVFETPNCGPCQALRPALDDLAREFRKPRPRASRHGRRRGMAGSPLSPLVRAHLAVLPRGSRGGPDQGESGACGGAGAPGVPAQRRDPPGARRGTAPHAHSVLRPRPTGPAQGAGGAALRRALNPARFAGVNPAPPAARWLRRADGAVCMPCPPAGQPGQRRRQ